MIYGLRVFAIGGGTGLSTLLAGLRRYVEPPQPSTNESVYIADIAAMVTVTDDGGSSGRLRNEFQMVPPGDIRNCLVALSEDESLLSSLFQYRFAGNGDLGGHNFGNLFLTALTAVTGDFSEALRAAGHVLAVRGRIFPSTTTCVSLVAELEDGRRLRGETNIVQADARVRRVFLDPPDCAPPEDALVALRQADLVLLGPGSLYTSLLPNLLVPGVCDALASTNSMVVHVSNVMTQPGETTGYSLTDHVRALSDHCPGLRLSHILANGTPIPAETLARYQDEGSLPVTLDAGDDLPCPVAVEDLLLPGPFVRHDGVRTAKALLELFHRARVSVGGQRVRG